MVKRRVTTDPESQHISLLLFQIPAQPERVEEHQEYFPASPADGGSGGRAEDVATLAVGAVSRNPDHEWLAEEVRRRVVGRRLLLSKVDRHNDRLAVLWVRRRNLVTEMLVKSHSDNKHKR